MRTKIVFHSVLTILIFSIWALFALSIVNQYWHEELPGYTMGRICMWEGLALIIAGALSVGMTRRWSYPKVHQQDGRRMISMDRAYIYFFLAYFILAVGVGIWQFWVFSQRF